MTHLFKFNPRPCHPFRKSGKNRTALKLLLLPVTGLVLACASCSDHSPVTPPVPVNVEPVGDGLKVIGFAVLGAAVVVVLGRIMK